MLEEGKQKLIYFDEGLLAKHREDANLLKGWHFVMSVNGQIGHFFEEVNLQRYKIIRTAKKVQIAMREKKNEPFVFFVCKN